MEGEEIRRLREELGVSQKELARRLQVAHSTVNRWENGLSSPAGEVLARLHRLSRFKEFLSVGRLVPLADLVKEPPVPGNGLPPWHEGSDSVEPGHLSLLVAPPRCGKTFTALRWSYKACVKHGIPVFYVVTHWTAGQTARLLERAVAAPEPGVAKAGGLTFAEPGPAGTTPLDPTRPFSLFLHDGRDLMGLLEELSLRIGDSERSLVVFDWLQNLDDGQEPGPRVEERERRVLRELKMWAVQQRAYALVVASQRGANACDAASFPHLFELADSITTGAVKHLKRRRVEFSYQDLQRGLEAAFAVELGRGRDSAPEEADDDPPIRRGLRGLADRAPPETPS